MKVKRLLSGVCALCLCLTLAGCGGGTKVYVQSVARLMALGGIAPGDKFAGLVVSEHVAEIEKDADKAVAELMVKEGDDVKEGQPLFSYDTDELELNLDKAKLELDQLKASIETFKAQIRTLENERKNTTGTARLQYTVEIQSTQVDLKEAELKVKSKEKAVEDAAALLENSTVVSPIQGRVQSVTENGTDQMGNPLPYITIQQSGAYRVKGMLGELQRGGIKEGDKMVIRSRTNGDTWSGTVALVDYENPSQGNDMDRYYGMSADEMTASSKYPFYVDLDSTKGLILGQHVYVELKQEEGEVAGVGISSAFIAYEEDGTPYVWAEKNGRLEKRTVTLGEYDPMSDVQSVTEGLSGEDYIAFPDPELCREGASTTHDQVEVATEATEGEVLE